MYDLSQPYPSQRSPVAADNLVATSQPLAVEAGIQALRKGGNAVDAALSAAITLTVVEPNNNGLGSDAFCILWDGSELVGLNASGRSPARWTANHFEGLSQMPVLGWDAVTVPGAVSAWVALSRRYGKLSFQELFESAIHYAEEGFLVGPKSAYYWKLLENYYKGFDSFKEHFHPIPSAGERFVRKDMVRTLHSIAESEGEAFYRGEIADQIARASKDGGGLLEKSDLENHSADWVKPTSQSYRHVELCEIPPNGQGLAAQIALGILNHKELGPVDGINSVHYQIEAMKIAVRAANEHISDIDSMRLSVDELLDPESLARAAESINDAASAPPPVSLPHGKDTVYLTTADQSGMMVSFIQSNYMAFGSGIVIPGTGIAMQNRGSGFVLDQDHPNAVGGGKRPYHTIIPGFMTETGQPRMSFGVMGGYMQHQGHVQMVSRIADYDQNPQAASDAPRWHVKADYDVLLENGFDESVVAQLRERGHRVEFDEKESTFGGAQLILRTEDGYVGGSDHRKEGLVAGF